MREGFLTASAAPSETNEELMWKEEKCAKGSEHCSGIPGSTSITVFSEHGAHNLEPLGPE